MHLSIRWKFILSIGITLLVTYLGLLAWDYWWQRETASQEMQQLVSVVAQNLAERYNAPLSGAENSVDAIANNIEQQPPSADIPLGPIRPLAQFNSALIIAFTSDYATEAKLKQHVTEVGGPQQGGRAGPRRGGRGDGGRGGPPGRGGNFGAEGPGRADQTGRGGPFGAPPGQGPGALEPVSSFDLNVAPFSKIFETHRALWVEPRQWPFLRGSDRAAYCAPVLSGEKVIGAVIAFVPVSGANPGQEARSSFGRSGRGPAEEPAPQPTTLPAVPMFSALRESTLIGSDGVVIVPPAPPGATRGSIIAWAKSAGYPGLADDLQNALDGENSAVLHYRLQDAPDIIPGSVAGESYWVAFAPVASTDWVVTSAISESEFMDPIVKRLWNRALFLVGGLAILLAVTTIVSIRVSRPIERMASAVNQLAAGDLEAQVRGVHSKDEVGQLAVAFNTMTGQLKAHIAELTKATAARENVEAELRIARQIQTDLLPRTFPPFPDRKEFDLHAVNLAAKRVAGDFFDFFFAPGDLLTIVIADVSGKGMPAALLMAVTRTIVRNLAMEGLSPAQIIERANAMLVQDLSDSMFVSLFLCQYDTHSGRITYVNAGHPPPYRIGPDGTTTVFGEVTGAILGVNPTSDAWSFSQRQDQLRPGETLLLYTDGVTEARAPDGSMFRAAGLEQLLMKFHDETVEGLCARIVDEVNRYQNGQPIDDVTLVALRRRA